jgi:GTPase SAR1 family protein
MIDFSRAFRSNPKETNSINFWDFSGQKAFQEMRDEFYKEMNAILLIFDITSKKSFENVDQWFREASSGNGRDCMYFLVGTKGDCAKTRTVKETDAQAWAKTHNTK